MKKLLFSILPPSQPFQLLLGRPKFLTEQADENLADVLFRGSIPFAREIRITSKTPSVFKRIISCIIVATSAVKILNEDYLFFDRLNGLTFNLRKVLTLRD